MSENNLNENKTKTQKKKSKLIIIFSFLLILIIGAGVGYRKYSGIKDNVPQIDSEQSKYEILDKSVLNTDTLKSWNDDNKGTKQTSTTTDDIYTYALITYGNTTEPDVGICLEAVDYSDSITISYSIIKGKSTEQVAEYTPEMLLRFMGNNLKLKFKDITDEQQKRENEQANEQVVEPAGEITQSEIVPTQIIQDEQEGITQTETETEAPVAE